MNDVELLETLDQTLEAQMSLFGQLLTEQEELVLALEQNAEFSKIMDLLKSKEGVVQKIGEATLHSRPYISDFLQQKQQLMQNPKYASIEQKLNQLETMVELMKVKEDQVIQWFSKPTTTPEQTLNLVHAYRGLY